MSVWYGTLAFRHESAGKPRREPIHTADRARGGMMCP
jgi:hypothetical protein